MGGVDRRAHPLLPPVLRGNEVYADISLQALLLGTIAYVGVAYATDRVLEFLLAGVLACAVAGVHLLLSHLWLVCTLICWTATNQPLLQTLLGLFGFFGVLAPWYVMLVMMVCRDRCFPGARIFPTWSRWVIMEMGQYSEKAHRDYSFVGKRMNNPLARLAFFVIFHGADMACHLIPGILALRRITPEYVPSAIALGVVLNLVWYRLVAAWHLKVYLGALRTEGRILLLKSMDDAPKDLLFNFVDVNVMREMYAVTPAPSKTDVRISLLTGLATALMLVVLPPSAVLNYCALQLYLSEQWLVELWKVSGVAVMVANCVCIKLVLPCLYGGRMDVE